MCAYAKAHVFVGTLVTMFTPQKDKLVKQFLYRHDWKHDQIDQAGIA